MAKLRSREKSEPVTSRHGHAFQDHSTVIVTGQAFRRLTEDGHRFLHFGTYEPSAPPPEPDQGTWTIDRWGGVSQLRGEGWGEPGIMPFGKWEVMWEARGPLLECGPWGAPLERDPSEVASTGRQDDVKSAKIASAYGGRVVPNIYSGEPERAGTALERVVCLCGSTRFKDEFMRVNRVLTLAGKIVLMPGVFGHAEDETEPTPSEKAVLDRLHLNKIGLSSLVYVVDPGGYIGESTRKEIEFAEAQGVRVEYYSRDPRFTSVWDIHRLELLEAVAGEVDNRLDPEEIDSAVDSIIRAIKRIAEREGL